MRALPAGAHGGARLATDSCAQADYFMVCGSDAPVRRWVSLCAAKRCCTLREATRTPSRVVLTPDHGAWSGQSLSRLAAFFT